MVEWAGTQERGYNLNRVVKLDLTQKVIFEHIDTNNIQ